MTPILSVVEFEQLQARDSVLPLVQGTETLDNARILAALDVATGEIVTYLPWLLDAVTGEVALPLPPQFASALRGICADLALIRLTDIVSSKEDDRNRGAKSYTLLKTIAAEHQGGLLGPEYQGAEIVEEGPTSGIADRRFWKKEGLY